MVESQHIAATMKLVDDRAEQDLLESLLETSKPPVADTDRLDYLLATPFRYDPQRGGSRFRGETDPGVFYGAESMRTAGAELGYWRWKFLMASDGLDRIGPVPHTAFSVAVDTQVVDLQRAPFDADAATWRHPTDYAPTQRFARVAREVHGGPQPFAPAGRFPSVESLDYPLNSYAKRLIESGENLDQKRRHVVSMVAAQAAAQRLAVGIIYYYYYYYYY